MLYIIQCSGNPAMYEEYWKHRGDEITVVIPGWQFISYFSDLKNLCWFLEPELAKQAIRLHNLVGNAVTQDRHIVVGTGSSQLYEAVLYALTTADSPEPLSVVSAAPYYSVRFISYILFYGIEFYVSIATKRPTCCLTCRLTHYKRTT